MPHNFSPGSYARRENGIVRNRNAAAQPRRPGHAIGADAPHQPDSPAAAAR